MKKLGLHLIIIITLICQLFPNQSVSANPVSLPSNNAQQLDILRQDSSVVIAESDDTGAVTFIGSTDGSPVLEGTSLQSAQPTEKSASALQKYAPLFGISNYKTDLFLMGSKVSDNGRTNVRYQQVYKGIPVIAGEIIMNMSSTGSLYSMSGEASPELSLDTKTKIDPTEAARQATELMTSRYGVSAADVILTDPELWIYDERLLLPSTMPPELVYRFEATSNTDKSLNILILVNAIHGGIRLQFNQIDTDTTGQTWKQYPLAQEGSTTEVPVVETTEPPTETPIVTETPVVTETPTEMPTESPTEMNAEPILPDPQQYDGTGVTWYVSPTGLDTNECIIKTAPCKTITGAQSKSAPGDQIFLAEGTYTENVYISRDVTIKGGWDSSFTIQNGFSVITQKTAGTAIYVIAPHILSAERLHLINSDQGLEVVNGARATLVQSFISGTTLHGIQNSGFVFLKNVTISGNTGTAINNVDGTIDIANSTITNNISSGNPTSGGIMGGGFTIRNSILAGNFNGTTPFDCYTSTLSTAPVSYGNNIIGTTHFTAGDVDCRLTLGTGDQTGVDPKLGVLQPSGIHPLLATSPAVDAGNSGIPGSGGYTCETNDQLGRARPVDGNNDGTARCDIGAYETDPPITPVITTISVQSGSAQSINILRPYTNVLQALVSDQFGAPMSNIEVTFTAPTSGASAAFSGSATNTIKAVTNIYGIASSPILTANSVVGDFVIQATAAGLPSSANFQLHNLQSLTWYVSPLGNDANDCRTPATVCNNILAPRAKTGYVDGDTIFLAEGVYTSTNYTSMLVVQSDLVLNGGWDSTFEHQVGYSTLDGQNTRRAMDIYLAVVTLQRINMINGFAESAGGAISLLNADLTLIDSKINNNHAKDFGGGILNSGHLTVIRSSITNNTAGAGGGIFSYMPSTLSLINSTISYNIASFSDNSYSGGGGIYSPLTTTTINNSTISYNSTNHHGGGINGPATISNSIIANNTSLAEGTNCYDYPITSSGHNIIGNDLDCNITPAAGDQFNSDPKISFNDELGINFLLPGSPAIDSGDTATCVSVDQRGVTRPVDGNGDGTSTCDIGSFEFSGSGSVPSIAIPNSIYPRFIHISNHVNIPFIVTVLDSSGSAVAGASVTFTAPTSGASGIFSSSGTYSITITTNSLGMANAGDFVANSTPGVYSITTTIAGITDPINFKVSNNTQQILTHTLNNQTVPPRTFPGTLVCNETQIGCTNGSDLDADHAEAYAISAYLFFLVHHNRNSLDNAGIPILNTVHYDIAYENSYWNGNEAVFGDDEPTDDTVAHELTHGVTDYTSNLYYYYQSGAINESFSDLWGEFIDQTNEVGNDEVAVKWLLGEDNYLYRSMSNPPTFGNPDKMTSSLYHYGDLEDLDSIAYDNGGVHTNSGINNKAVYLMTDGGNFNGYSINGIGLNKVAAIYYDVQTDLLTSGSNYKDLFYAVHQACVANIGGSEGISLQDCNNVQNALNAVEMDKDPLGTFIAKAELCPANTQPSNLFFDDFESSNSKWNLSDYSNPESYWGRTPGYSTSGSYSLYAPSLGSTSDTRASLATGVSIPSSGTTYLFFNHAFGYEYSPLKDGYYKTWDGAVLEYKIDNGSWQDARVLYDNGQDYNGSVSNISGGTNPLIGKPAFVSDSHGYVSSRFKLDTTAIKGHSINFRWRVGTDSTVGDLGWAIDDVRIYQCQSAFPGNLILSDDFSTNYLWANSTAGNIYRDTNNNWLTWTSKQNTPLHYSIPIHATNAPIKLNFRFKINSTGGNSMLWVGLARELDEISPAVSGADRAGTFIGIDSNNKIQFLSLLPNGLSSQVNSATSSLAYGGTQVWRNVSLTIDQLNWTITLKDDNGSVIGNLSGTLPSQQDDYDYLTMMYDNGSGTDSIAGLIDDIYVYGTEKTAVFNDVPFSYTETLGGTTYQLHPYIQALYNAGLTVGTTTNPPAFSPALTLDRSMAAVFMLRGNFGTTYTPPAAPWNTFTNESWANNAYAQKWAEGMYQVHLTAGCQTSPLKYCPDRTLTREEAAVFALHLKYDTFDGNGNLVSSYTPPAATGSVLADMTDKNLWSTKWAEKAYMDGLIPPCGTIHSQPLFCPSDPVDRAWAAYMIVKAKNLTLPE